MATADGEWARITRVSSGEWQIRALGALFGGLVPAATAAVIWWIGLDDQAEAAATVGVLAGLISGGLMGPRALSSRSMWLPGVAAAVLGTLLGTIATLVVAAVAQPYALLLFPMFLVYGTAIGLPVALPTALITVALIRASSQRRWRAATSVLTLCAIIVLLGAPAIAYADAINARRALPSLRSKPPVAVLLAVQLEWEIANCSPWHYTLRITETDLGGTQVIHELVAPAQSAVRGRLSLQPGWRSAIEAEPAADIPEAWRGAHDAARDALGDDMAVRFEIALDGLRTTHIRSAGRDDAGSLCVLEPGSRGGA